MTVRVLVVAEGPSDARTGCALADRVLIEHDPRLDGRLDTHRRWEGEVAEQGFLAWHDVRRAYEANGLGRFSAARRDLRNEGVGALRALFLARRLQRDAVLLLRDLDNEPARRDHLHAAREHASAVPCVIGTASPMREAWALHGFLPQDAREEARLGSMRRELGFDPTLHADRLTARTKDAKKQPKRVLAHLVDDDADREAACWSVCPLAVLRERGQRSHLTAFLDEVATTLAPIVAASATA
jgi:hypothetical protein